MVRSRKYILSNKNNIYKIKHDNLLLIILTILGKLIFNSAITGFVLVIIAIVFNNLMPLLFYTALLISISLEESLHFLFAKNSKCCKDVVVEVENINFLGVPAFLLRQKVKFLLTNRENFLNLVKIFLLPPLIPLVIILISFLMLSFAPLNLPLDFKKGISYVLYGCFVLHLFSILPYKIGWFMSDGYTLIRIRKERR